MTVTELAGRVVAAALADPDITPGQWVYRRNAVVAVPEQADSPVVVERWFTADGSTGAAYVAGDLINDFARHCIKPLFRRLLLLTQGDHALADDLVQEVLEEVYIEQLTSALYLHKPVEVDSYLEVMEQLCQQAEPTGRTVGILRRILWDM